ncbi:hypothetical protein CJ255_22015, partial [Candidatus Viridilinea mediisalina]
MKPHRSWIVLGLLLLSIALSHTALSATAQQDEDVLRFDQGQGLNNSALQGWPRTRFNGGLAGRFYEVLNAPRCADAPTPACRVAAADPLHQVELLVEHTSNEATVTAAMWADALLRQGYQAEQVQVAGYAALRLTSLQADAAYAAVYTLELEDVFYLIGFSRSFLAEPDALVAILAAFELDPSTAPLPFRHEVELGAELPDVGSEPITDPGESNGDNGDPSDPGDGDSGTTPGDGDG